MKAARLHGQEDLRIDDIAEPTLSAGSVKVRNAFSGICGSDLHAYFHPGALGLDGSPHPLTGATLPQVMGHEFSGTVVELGESVNSVAVGDRVSIWPIYSCGKCSACSQGMVNACREIGFHGLTASGGGMAEFTTVPASMVHVLPEHVSLRMGALVEPMAVGWHAVVRSGIVAGGSAVIAGAGPIGIGLWFALRANGVEKVIVSEPNAERRDVIAALGARVVDPRADDVTAVIDTLTDGDGFDVAFDAAGVGAALDFGLANLTPGGRVVVVAIHENPVEFLPTRLVMTETGMTGSLAYLSDDFDSVIAAMADGHYDTSGWVEEVGLEDVVEAIHRLRQGQGSKILVRSAS